MALPTLFGTELAGTVYGGAAENTPFIGPDFKEGRLRYVEANLATGAGIAVGTVGLLILPSNAKVVRIEGSFGAMGDGVTMSLGLMTAYSVAGTTTGAGTVISATEFATTLDVSSAGTFVAASLGGSTAAIAQGALYVTTEQDLLYITLAGATTAGSKAFRFFVWYVVD